MCGDVGKTAGGKSLKSNYLYHPFLHRLPIVGVHSRKYGGVKCICVGVP